MTDNSNSNSSFRRPLLAVKSLALWPIRLLKRFIFVTGLVVWFALTLLAVYVYQVFQLVPSHEDLAYNKVRPHAESLILSNSINSTLNHHNHWIELNAVNRDLLYAIVLSEDANFFSHEGIDYDALISALGENIKSREWRFGASTISQQTAKNLYLSNNKTFTRKLQELIITRRLEKTLTKNQILELYLNLIEFGPELYGIGNASQYYFKKNVDKINAAEGAYLALLMPSPRKYHYTLYQNGNWSPALKKKHHRILRDMRYKELISAKQFKRYARWQYSAANYD